MNMISITTKMTITNLATKWCVYMMIDDTTQQIVYVGVSRITQLFTLADARALGMFDLNKDYRIVAGPNVFDNVTDATRERYKLMNDLRVRIIPVQHSPAIKCVTTGEEFPSSAEVVRQHGVAPSNLSNHLKGRPGFKTVKGNVYIKIMPGQNK